MCPEQQTQNHILSLNHLLFISGNSPRMGSQAFVGFLQPPGLWMGHEATPHAKPHLTWPIPNPLCSSLKPSPVFPLVSSPPLLLCWRKSRPWLLGPKPSTTSTVLTCSVEVVACDCMLGSIFLAYWGGGQADDRRESEPGSLSGSY